MTEPSDTSGPSLPRSPQVVGGILYGASFYFAHRLRAAQGLGLFPGLRHVAAQTSTAGVGLSLLDYLPALRPDAEQRRLFESPVPPAFYLLLPVVAFPQASFTALRSLGNVIRNPVGSWNPLQVLAANETLRFYQRLRLNPHSLWSPLFEGLRNMPTARELPRTISAGVTRASIAAPLGVEIYRALMGRRLESEEVGFGSRYLLELAGSMLVGGGVIGSAENAISQRTMVQRFQRGLPFLFTSLYGGLLLDRRNIFYFDTNRPSWGTGYGDNLLESRRQPSNVVEALRLSAVSVVSAAFLRRLFTVYSNPLASPVGAVGRLNELLRLAVLGPTAANVAGTGRIRGHVEFDPSTYTVSARLRRGNLESREGDSLTRDFVRGFMAPLFETAGVMRMLRATTLRAGWRGALFYLGGQIADTLSDARVGRYRIEFSDPPERN